MKPSEIVSRLGARSNLNVDLITVHESLKIAQGWTSSSQYDPLVRSVYDSKSEILTIKRFEELLKTFQPVVIEDGFGSGIIDVMQLQRKP